MALCYSCRFPGGICDEPLTSHIGGASGGYLEHIARFASQQLSGGSLDKLQYKVLRLVPS